VPRLLRDLLDEADVVERERDGARIAQLLAQIEGLAHLLEGEVVVALEPVHLARVVLARCDPAIVPRHPEQRHGRAEVAQSLVEPPRLPVHATDAVVRGARLVEAVHAPGQRAHPLERLECSSGLASGLLDVSQVVQQLHGKDRLGIVEALEGLREEADRPAEGVAGARRVARAEPVHRCLLQPAALLEVSGDHVELLLAPLLELVLEPLGEVGVVALERGRVGHPADHLALQVVLEGVLHVTGERGVGDLHDVVALDQAIEQLADLDRDVLGAPPDGWRLEIEAAEGHEASQPEHRSHAQGLLEDVPLCRRERAVADLDRLLDAELKSQGLEPLEVNGPHALGVLLDGLVLLEDLHELLEEERVSAGHVAHGLDELIRKVLELRQEVRQQPLGVDPRERTELDAKVALRGLEPVWPLDEQFRRRDADEQDGHVVQVLAQVPDDGKGLAARELQILEREDDGILARVLLEEPLQDRAPDLLELLRMLLHGIEEGVVGEPDVHERAEEVEELGDPPVPEEIRDLPAELILDLRGLEALEDSETGPEDPREDAKRPSLGLRDAAVDLEVLVLGPGTAEELGQDARLADPVVADDRDHRGLLLLHDLPEQVLEVLQLAGPPDDGLPGCAGLVVNDQTPILH